MIDISLGGEMRSKAVLAVAGVILASCSSEPVTLQSRFDPTEVAWFVGRGTNTIEGSAIVRSYSGTVKTCAALPVMLFPVSAYARERMMHLYGSGEEGYNLLAGGRPADFTNDDPRYQAAVKTTRCDARGRFAFSELPDGDYYLVATVTWRERAQGMDEGGMLMRRVHVSTGETKDVLLAH
jgi:hypothetical protein